MPRAANPAVKRNGRVICLKCKKVLTTQRFKSHFERHLRPGEVYHVRFREKFEISVNDPRLLEDPDTTPAFFAGAMERIEARMTAMKTLIRRIAKHQDAGMLSSAQTDEGLSRSEGEDDNVNEQDESATSQPDEPRNKQSRAIRSRGSSTARGARVHRALRMLE